MFYNNRGVSIVLIILALVALLIIAAGFFSYQWVKNLTPEKIIKSDFVQKRLSAENREAVNLLPRLLGFTKPITYLILFENNTELRPGGGFIGVYAVIRMNKGKMEIVKMEGTENLDRYAPADWKPTPPKPISEQLKVDRWYFRDANWSPDFSVSAEKALELYKAEKGAAADEIDAVAAFTPTVLEELLRLTGPLTAQGMEFTAENVTEKLEYEVEYGYDDKGVAFTERKQIILPLFSALIGKLESGVFANFSDYFSLAEELIKEKQIMAYAPADDLQKIIIAHGLDGRMAESSGDYLLWVDANLAALKTDYALKRSLYYEFSEQPDGRLLALAQMAYSNQGEFDWRTTRYRTYARVFVPAGSELVLVEQMNEMGATKKITKFDQGEELGKKWFGAFISIEPGQTMYLNFHYLLPSAVSDAVANGAYTLLAQKQLGTIASGLTLNLNFGNNIKIAEPAEVQSNWGDKAYKYSGDLREDRNFVINL